MGRPLSVFTLSEAEEETLRSLARRRTTAQALALRAVIVLACAAGDPNQVVARKLGVTPKRCANGEPASLRSGWTASMTSRVRAYRARSTMPRSRR